MSINTRPRQTRPIAQSDAGLTIIELLIVLVILSLVATVTTVQIMNQFGRAQSDILTIQFQQIRYAIELYQIDTGELPTEDQGLKALFKKPDSVSGWRGPYVTDIKEIVDPWKTEIKLSLEDNEYGLISAGPDRKFDGGGDDISIHYSF